MKKSILLSLLVVFTFSCGSGTDDGLGGGTTTDTFLITGDTEQTNVGYTSSNVELNFSQVEQIGDSTFSVANLDLDGNNSTDLTFRLVSWTDNTVLTASAGNEFSITEGGSEFEIINAGVSLKTISLFPAGTILNSLINISSSSDLLFITHVFNGSQTSADPRIWNETVYLPFQSSSQIGWVGLSILANSSNAIQGIQINTIAIR